MSTTLLARLSADHPGSSGRRLRQWLAAGRVSVNGRIAHDPRDVVGPGDAVVLLAHAPAVFPARLRLVHEDANLLVIDKPPGLLTIGTPRERQQTAYRMVWDYLAACHPPRRPFIVHRLDRETSGLLVVAKSPRVKASLQTQFAAGTVERVYVAVVEGNVREDEQRLETVLVEEEPGLRVRPAGPREQAAGRGRRAVTHVRVLARGVAATLLELLLLTGRRHQIRVQLAGRGHPVLGDPTHGSRRDPLRRLCLHATRLGFRHPATGARLSFTSPYPAGFGRLGGLRGQGERR